jgi:hypothetical protein
MLRFHQSIPVDSAEQARERAIATLTELGFASPQRELLSSVRLTRGNLGANFVAFSPRWWKCEVTLTPVKDEPPRLEAYWQINSIGQWVTHWDVAYFEQEFARVEKAALGEAVDVQDLHGQAASCIYKTSLVVLLSLVIGLGAFYYGSILGDGDMITGIALSLAAVFAILLPVRPWRKLSQLR